MPVLCPVSHRAQARLPAGTQVQLYTLVQLYTQLQLYTQVHPPVLCPVSQRAQARLPAGTHAGTVVHTVTAMNIEGILYDLLYTALASSII